MKKNRARDEEVARLFKAGSSMTAIGALLGISRSTASGIIFRARGLAALPAARPIAPRGPSKQPRAPRPPKPARHGDAIRAGWVAHKANAVSVPLPPRPKAVPVGPLPETGTVAYLAWRSGQCHFPMWGGDDFNPFTSMFCGRAVEGESQYCGPHKHLCRQALSSSRVARDTREVEAA